MQYKAPIACPFEGGRSITKQPTKSSLWVPESERPTPRSPTGKCQPQHTVGGQYYIQCTVGVPSWHVACVQSCFVIIRAEKINGPFSSCFGLWSISLNSCMSSEHVEAAEHMAIK